MEINSDKNHKVKPLVVDLDGTLVKTNMLFESANNIVVRHPLRFIYSLFGIRKGISYFKSQLADTCHIAVTKIPYNDNVLIFLDQQKALGREIILATASHLSLAEAVAKHLGLFNGIMATEGEVNLKSDAKRDLLVERFGEKGFDYIGNSYADLPVWKSAHSSYVVSSSQALIDRVRSIGNLAAVFSCERAPFVHELLKAIRPHQWVKNILIFIPLLAAHYFGNLNSIIQSFIAFIVFCLAASSVYLLNDLIDVAEDRYHYRKRYRPFASGNLSLLLGWVLWPIFFILSCTIAIFTLSGFFCVVLAAYFVLTMAYSLWFKQIAIMDVVILAGLYTLRILAGAAAIGAPISFWLLAFSTFNFLSLAFIKRFCELKSARQSGVDEPLRGRGYVHHDLEIVASMGVGAGYLAVLVLALYIQDAHTIKLYHSPQFIWVACPLLLYWFSRAWLIADRGQMQDDPIVFAIKDRVSWLVGACFIVIFGLAMVVR